MMDSCLSGLPKRTVSCPRGRSLTFVSWTLKRSVVEKSTPWWSPEGESYTPVAVMNMESWVIINQGPRQVGTQYLTMATEIGRKSNLDWDIVNHCPSFQNLKILNCVCLLNWKWIFNTSLFTWIFASQGWRYAPLFQEKRSISSPLASEDDLWYMYHVFIMSLTIKFSESVPPSFTFILFWILKKIK